MSHLETVFPERQQRTPGPSVRAALVLSACGSLTLWTSVAFCASEPTTTAIVCGTIIDGNGSAPIEDGVVVITGREITKLGQRGEIKVPRRAKVIDASGRYVVPGFIDTNVHLDLNLELFPLLVYGDYDSYFQHSLAIEAAQMALKHGVTTVLDTYGPLLPLIKLRERIKAGEIAGPRLMVAGNIIGWDGPLSPYETKRKLSDLKMWEKNHSVWWRQGTGAALTQMYVDEVKDAINKYIDLGPDFIKVGVTTHDIVSPVMLSFSPRVLRTIVDTAHARGLKVQAHSGSVEGHQQSVEAGVDVITHASYLYSQKLRPEFAKGLCNSDTTFALFAYVTFPPYEYLRRASGVPLMETPPAQERIKNIESITPDRNRTPRLQESLDVKLPGENPAFTFFKENGQTMIQAGCKIAVATDSAPATYDDIVGHSKSHTDMGIGTLHAIEGLVNELGMTPAQAIAAGTKGGAVAAGLLDRIGTIEQGKVADLLILDGDPLEDIANIRRIFRVIHDGKVTDPASLPTVPRFYKR